MVRNNWSFEEAQQGAKEFLKTVAIVVEAAGTFERAVELDPNYINVLAALAALYWDVYKRDWLTVVKLNRDTTKHRAEDYLKKALANPTPLAFQVSSKMLLWRRDKYEEAVAEARMAIALDPNG